MDNIFKYIDKYGNFSVDKKPINEVDILIFSQIPYLNLKNIIPSNTGMRIKFIWENAKDKNAIIRGTSHKNAVRLIKKMTKSKRYENFILRDFEYVLGPDVQFGAVTIVAPDGRIYVAFEGTDDAIAGWKEDFKLTYIYPVPAQKLAYEYLNRVVKLTGPKVVVCGHSKGGNLSLVGAMNMNIFKRHKIEKIYSFDGPGLKMKEFKSWNYKTVRKKLVNIIPNQSLVGILLEQEKVRVIKSFGIGAFQHDPTTWIVKDDKFKPTHQDRLSIQLDESINRWLAKHDYENRRRFTEGFFSVFESAGIESTYDILENKLSSLRILVKTSKDMDKETKDMIIKSIKLLAVDFGTDFIEDSKNIAKEKIKILESKIKSRKVK